jgi:Acetyltransferase (GNAT) domain
LSSNITKYNSAYKKSILTLMRSKPLKSEIWDWQFNDNPIVGDFDPIMITDKWGTVIGFNGIMPTRIQHNNNVIRGMWSCDFYVDNRFRGQKIGQKIKHRLHECSNVIMALGISNMASHVLLRMGWKPNEEVKGFRIIIRVRNFKTMLLYVIQRLNIIINLQPVNSTKFNIAYVSDLPDRKLIDDLWGMVSKDYDNIVVRDYSYLYWRYEKHPLANYKYILAKRGNDIKGLIVVRVVDRYGVLVDYVGPRFDFDLKYAVLIKLLKICKNKEYLNCITSDDEWKSVLLATGFYCQRSEQRFYVYSKLNPEPDIINNWFIMGGDSDGEMLIASRTGALKKVEESVDDNNHKYTIKKLTELEFSRIEKEWNGLILNSNADPLFLGWIWQYNWWKQWAKDRKYKLHLLAAYTEDNKLAGIAPMYMVSKKIQGGRFIKQLQFIGSSWGAKETVRTEYLNFITHKCNESVITSLFLEYLNNDSHWDQIVFADVETNSLTSHLLEDQIFFSNDYHRVVHEDKGTYIDTSGNFEKYKLALGKNSRLKVFNRRNLLCKKGEIKIEKSDSDSIDSYFNFLNELHILRWGKPCFNNESLNFHKNIARKYYKQNKLNLSRITLSDEPVSILYNIRMRNIDYNIQSGYYDNLDKKLSLGSLHLGYEIENAFNSPDINRFDLLAGQGKNTYYKSHYSSRCYNFVTIQINRPNYLIKMYRYYDAMPVPIKTTLMKYFFRKTNI